MRMVTGRVLSSSGRRSNIARQPLMDSSGRAEVISSLPRLASITASTPDSVLSLASSPPAKSTAKRHEKYLRGWPTMPPMPVRVATQRPSGGCIGGCAPQ